MLTEKNRHKYIILPIVLNIRFVILCLFIYNTQNL